MKKRDRIFLAVIQLCCLVVVAAVQNTMSPQQEEEERNKQSWLDRYIKPQKFLCFIGQDDHAKGLGSMFVARVVLWVANIFAGFSIDTEEMVVYSDR